MPWRYIVKGQPVQSVKKEIARNLRQEMTQEEDILWQELRDNKLGVKFRRQQVISGFIADFYCHKLGLIVEADGAHHTSENDCERDAILISNKLHILRFPNEQIRNDIEYVLAEIRKYI